MGQKVPTKAYISGCMNGSNVSEVGAGKLFAVVIVLEVTSSTL